MGKRLSPFQTQFWVEKGYSEQDAEFHAKACRPVMPEYWIKRGFDINEAKSKALESKNKNNKLGGKANASRPIEDRRKESSCCLEYWLEKGFNLEEAKEKRKERQQTFTLDKCIERHGKKEGTKIWQDRQDRWQTTLNNKSDEEKARINSTKSLSYKNLIGRGRTREQIKEIWLKLNQNKIFDSVDELKQYLKNHFQENPHACYMPYGKLRFYLVPKYCQEWLNLSNQEIRSLIEPFLKQGKFKIHGNKNRGEKQAYRMWVGNALLRSMHEIYFYELLCQYNIDHEIDGFYPNSKMRYDFYIPSHQIFIEIAPLYNNPKEEKYTIKMNKKAEVFGAHILNDSKEFDQWIQNNLIKK